MKKYFLASALLAIAMSVQAQSDVQPYLSAKLGVAHMQNKANATGDYITPKRGNHFHYIGTDQKHSGTVVTGRIAGGATFALPAGKVRAELELGQTDNFSSSNHFTFTLKTSNPSTYSVKTAATTVMANAYYDIDTGSAFTPYVGAGLGVAHIKAKQNVKNATTDQNITTSGNKFAWNVTLGAGYALNEHLTLDGGYRYTNYGKLSEDKVLKLFKNDLNTSSTMKVDSHELFFGARYNF